MLLHGLADYLGIESPWLIRVDSAAINFTKENFALDVNGDFDKNDTSFLQENETTVSVTWTGGGQDLKKRESIYERRRFAASTGRI